ncbi:Neurotensin receptor type 1 [Pseudolycoriella hygida]|uniref:Neurotensin receptor type 1 n=1 Tax=Pseudolycoriella hygida TaxID=35572 RepID=A0A9Q0RX93_9DIPT|nr:Neurotensin receptor type 1 [Pseudolycoriella hygida]
MFPILFVADYRNEEYFDGTPVMVCLTEATNPWSVTFFIMTISAFFLLPLMILVILYSIIAKNLISKDSAMQKIRPSKPELSLKARKQVVFMLGAVVLSFFLCLLPFRVLTLWIILAPDEKVKSFGVESYYNVLYFSRIMLYLNSAINPILYNLMSSKFRSGFKRVVCCFCWKKTRLSNGCPRVPTLNTTTSSFLSHSLSRRSQNSKTMSMTDLRINSYTPNQWTQCSFKHTTMENTDELRKVAFQNFLRQNSALQSDGEDGMGLLTQQRQRPIRQSSYDDDLFNKTKRKKVLLLQYSLDDHKLSNDEFVGTELKITNRCSDQNPIPFTR